MTPAITAPSVTLSARAAARIQSIRAADPTGGDTLRVAVEGGGCSGFQYKMDMVHRTAVIAGDPQGYHVIERDGAHMLVDTVSIGLLEGSEVDFVDDLIGSSFQIRNPNATSSCGCGTSFSL